MVGYRRTRVSLVWQAAPQPGALDIRRSRERRKQERRHAGVPERTVLESGNVRDELAGLRGRASGPG